MVDRIRRKVIGSSRDAIEKALVNCLREMSIDTVFHIICLILFLQSTDGLAVCNNILRLDETDNGFFGGFSLVVLHVV